MPETICVNTWLLIGLAAMAALGFIRAVIDVWHSMKPKPSPFQ